MYKCYPSVVTCLSELAETNSTAKALYKYFSSTKAVLLNSFMLDIHDTIAFLSSITKKITCVTVKSSPFFQALIVGLEQLKTGGKHFQEK